MTDACPKCNDAKTINGVPCPTCTAIGPALPADLPAFLTKDTQDRADDNQVWYVVNGRCWDADDIPDPLDTNWTVSTNPTEPGWNTDDGYPGYGLTRADAEFLAAAANEKINREKSN